MQPLLGDTGPSGGHRQHLAVSQPYAIGNTALERFWATRRPPACLLWRLFEGSWASLKLLVAPLWSNPGPSAACHLAGAGPIPCYQHGLSREVWASLKPSVADSLATLVHHWHVI